MHDEVITTQETLTGTDGTMPPEVFTKPMRDGNVSYIEREVERFDFEGYEVVRRELFSK